MKHSLKIGVVIPCYKVKTHIIGVIGRIGAEVSKIYVIDDACPDFSGLHVENSISDERVCVVYHPINLGVGGAVMTGFRKALDDGIDIIVKLDGDGQMDPALINYFVMPIVERDADYTKGNRFFDLESIRQMPKVRLLGNAALSFITKISTGYWNILDPTNGYVATHADVIRHLPLEKISHRYFFESDMLFRLGLLRAVVMDIPMDSKYEDEESNLKIHKVVGEFFYGNIRNTLKRVVYNYYLRDVSIASLELPIGIFLMCFGVIFGILRWVDAEITHTASTSGTVMLAALPILLGMQLILAFLNYDIGSVPKQVISRSQGFGNKSIRNRRLQ